MPRKKAAELQVKAVIPEIIPVSEGRASGGDTILVMTGEATLTRGGGVQQLEVEKLAVNVNLFVQQLGKVLESTPEKLGNFSFDEFEIHAEISADGTIAVLGSGVHAGVGGGLRFVFRRASDKA